MAQIFPGRPDRLVMTVLGARVRALLLIAGALALVSFFAHLAIALAFDRLGAYFLNDVLFASDSRNFLATIAHGERSNHTLLYDLLNSIHPYVWFYFSPLVRAAARLAVIAKLTDASVLDVRLQLAVLVTPAVSAVQCFAFAVLLSLLGLPVTAVILLSLLNIASFSSLLYGSIPDHFAATNLMVTVLMIVAVASFRRPRLDQTSVWCALGVLVTGITIVNVAFFAIVHFFARLFLDRRGFWRTALRSGLFSVAVFAFVLLTANAAAFILHGSPRSDVLHQDFVARYANADVDFGARLGRLLDVLQNTLAPRPSDIREKPAPRVPVEHHMVTRPPMGEVAVYPRFTLERAPGSPGVRWDGAIVLAAMVAGALALFMLGGRHRMVALSAASIVGFNLVLHNYWGDEYVLYSQHWLASALVLIGGIFLVSQRARKWLSVALTLFVIAVAWNSVGVLYRVLSTMMWISKATGWPG